MVEEIEETTLEEVDVDFFEFIQLNKNVATIRLSEDIFDENSVPSYSSLLAVSNLYGYFVAGTSKGFIYASTKDLREAFYSSKADSEELFKQGIHINILEGRVHFLRLTLDQLTIIVGVKGGQALFYDVTKISTKFSDRPYQVMKFQDDIMDIRPNPGENENIIAFLLVSGDVYIKDFISNKEVGSIQSSKIGEQVTAICWSQKGKQLVCGNQSGKLVQFSPEGNEKFTHLAPSDIQQPVHCVRNILWLEAAIFIVTYYPVVQDENSEHVVYVVSRENKSKTVYSKAPDICFTSSDKSPYMFMESVKKWGSELKNVVICACTNSSDTNLIGRNESDEWSSWNLSETTRAILPLSDKETLPIGTALDLSSTESWVTKLTGDEDSQIPPVPILFIYNDESRIVAYRCFQKNAYLAETNYPGMTVPIPIPATGPSAASTAGPSMLKSIGTTTIGAQTTLASVSDNIPAPVTTSTTTNIPKNSVSSLGRPNNLKNNTAIAAVGSNTQNVPLKSQVKQTSPTGPNATIERSPHLIRLNATKKSVQEIQLLIDDVEKKYLIKYHERTKAESLENPNEWSIGDLPVIISETKRLEKEIKNIIESLSVLKQETTDLNLNFVKEDAITKQEIGLLVSTQQVTLVRGTIQSRITEKYEKAFQNVKENADALEKQLNMLYEQIKDHKANKSTGQPPLEYIDRSIRNISKGLYSNASQIEVLNTRLDLITEQLASVNFNENADDFVSQQIEYETRKSIIPVKCSDEAEVKTNEVMRKEWKLFKLLNVNKSRRKVPNGTNLFSDIEPVQSYISPKVISPRKSQSPIKTRSSTQIGIEKLKEPIDRNKHGSSLRDSFSFDEESDYYNELDTPIKKNTYTEFGLPINDDTDEVSQKYSKQVSEIRERRLRYFEKERNDVEDNEYVDNSSTYERTPLRETRVRFQEPSETKIYDDADEITEDSVHQKFERIVDSDPISRINLTNNDDTFDRLQIDPFEDNFYESSKFSDINKFSDYFISPAESPNAEGGVSYSLSNEQKDIITSEQSSTTQDSLEDSLDFDKIALAEMSSLSKVSEPHQYYDNEESKSDIETIERLAGLEKREEVIDPVKEEKIESTSLEEIFQVAAEPGEITDESKIAEVSQQPLTIEEKVVTNESKAFATGLGSFGLRESSPFGTTTSTPPTFGGIPNAFNIGSIPPAFATPPPNVSAFGQVQPQTFGQPSFGQSPQINAFAQPVFGQTGFGQQNTQTSSMSIGQPAFGQSAFGQMGFGVAPTPINTAAFKNSSGGFARFASGTTPPTFGGSAGFGKTPTSTSTNKPLNIPSDAIWQARK